MAQILTRLHCQCCNVQIFMQGAKYNKGSQG